MTAPVKASTDPVKAAPAIPLNTAICPPLVGAALAGVDTDALLAAVGLTRADAEDADMQLTAPQRVALWSEALRRSRDPALALHAAEHVPFGHFDLVDYLGAQAPTLGDALEVLVRYFRIVRADFHLTFETDDDEGRLVLALPPSFTHVASARTIEFTFGCFMTRFRASVPGPWGPLEACFAYPEPGHVDEYRRVFACPLRFDAPRSLLRIGRAGLAQPLPQADPRLRVVLERAGAAVLARLPPAPGLVSRLREVLSEELRGGEPTLERAARRMAIGARTLGRRLQDEGTSFQAQLAELRCELARGYLEDRRLSVAEVAYLLGFSDPSAFIRAFKRWTGCTPQAWRAQAA